jgi:hypothetical protein
MFYPGSSHLCCFMTLLLLLLLCSCSHSVERLLLEENIRHYMIP